MKEPGFKLGGIEICSARDFLRPAGGIKSSKRCWHLLEG